MTNVVAICSDAKYAPGVNAVINSIERNWRPFGRPFEYLILDCGLTSIQKQELNQRGLPLQICACHVPADYAAAIPPNLSLSVAAFARYELFRMLLENGYDRIFMLDADTLVLNSCDPVWDINAPFAARYYEHNHISNDFLTGFEAEMRSNGDPFLKIYSQPDTCCFNSGVLYLKNDPIHARLYRRLHEITVKYASYLRHADQSVLDYVTHEAGIEYRLPEEYNLWVGHMTRSRQDVRVLHYDTPNKPWFPNCLEGVPDAYHYLLELWQEYA